MAWSSICPRASIRTKLGCKTVFRSARRTRIRRPAVTLLTAHARTKSRLAWLLWFAFLLPLAQAASTWHVQSHWNAERTSPWSGKQLPLGERCDTCVGAAALSGGAVPASALADSHPAAAQTVPAEGPALLWRPVVLTAYESRAPPALLH